MSEQAYPDEVLMAYADGALDDDTARELEAALAADADLAARLKLFTGTRDVLAELARSRPVEPVPDDLMRRVEATLATARTEPSGSVLPFARPADGSSAAARPGATFRPAALAVAASLALAIGLGAGFGAGRLQGPVGDAPLRVSLLDAPGLDEALSGLATGDRRSLSAGEVRLIASFRDADGTFCREFEFDGPEGATVVSVVCRDGGEWDTRLAIATPQRDGTTFAPASSLDTLEAYLGAIGAGPVMSEAEEAQALDALDE